MPNQRRIQIKQGLERHVLVSGAGLEWRAAFDREYSINRSRTIGHCELAGGASLARDERYCHKTIK